MAKTKLKDRADKRKSKRPPRRQVSFTIGLLILMLLVGCISGVIAYIFGKQALQGVNPVPTGVKIPKPTSTPTPTNKPKKTSELFLLDEKEVVASIKQQMSEELSRELSQYQNPPTLTYARSSMKDYKPQLIANKDKLKLSKQIDAQSRHQSKERKFDSYNRQSLAKISSINPLASDSKNGVMMQVLSAQQQADSIVLQVEMQNFGAEPINLFPNEINARDNQGNTLKAIAPLPQKLPPTGEILKTTISIPNASLGQSNSLSVQFGQDAKSELNLHFNHIPVSQ